MAELEGRISESTVALLARVCRQNRRLRRIVVRMKPAFLFLGTTPTSGSLVFTDRRRTSARPATDARVVLVVKRVIRDALFDDAIPNLILAPIGKRAHLDQMKLLVPPNNGSN
jgi:hypothetical protein